MNEQTTGQAPTPTGQEPAAQSAELAAITPTGQEPNGLDALPESIRKLIADLRAENAAHRRAKQESEAAAKQAEEKRLEAERRFEELAQQRAARIAELEPVANRYEALAAKLTADMEREIAKLPAEIKALRPEGDLETLIEWTEKAKALAAKMQAAAAPGHAAPPRPAADLRPSQDQARTIAAMRAKF